MNHSGSGVVGLKVEVKGIEFDVQVDSKGVFSTQIDAEWVSAKSMDELIKKLTRGVKQKQQGVAIEFYRWESYDKKLRKGTVIGVHAGNGNTLVEWEDKTKNQESSYRGNDYLRLTEAEREEYVEMKLEDVRIGERIEEFETAHQFSPSAELRELFTSEGLRREGEGEEKSLGRGEFSPDY